MNLVSFAQFLPESHLRHFLRKFSYFLLNFHSLALLKTIGNPNIRYQDNCFINVLDWIIRVYSVDRGFPNFRNTTLANWTFTNGESPLESRRLF